MAAKATLEQQTPTQSVVECASLCLESFQQCLSKAASVHARELSLIEDQLARFSLWTANIGIFTPGRGSLDHRLREAPDVQDTVIGLLEALDYRVQNCSNILQCLSPVTSDGLLAAVDETFDQSVRGIANEISLLHRFSNTIRRASRETQNSTAAKVFRIRDEDGTDVEPFLQELFSNYIRDRFSEVSDSIRQRLASTMLLRRKRILYRRSRYGKTYIKLEDVPSQPSITRPKVRHATIAKDQSQECQATTMAPRSHVQSVAQTATTFCPENFQKASSPSVVSVSKSVALSNYGEQLPFPPAPCGSLMRKYNELKKQREEEHTVYLEYLRGFDESDGPQRLVLILIKAKFKSKLKEVLDKDWSECLGAIGEVNCPFCFSALPVQDVVVEKKWKLHVKNDLDPYVCLFEDCNSPEELYSHSDTWLKHMRMHFLRWRCISKSHSEFMGSAKSEYLSHMKASHSGKFTDVQLEVLANRNARMAGPMFKSCPLCGVEEVDGKMEDHVVGHLRFLALKSLPGYQEDTEEEDDPDSQKGSLAASRPQSRSTIKHDPERHTDLTFEDFGNRPPHIQQSDGSSKYQAWGGFRNYISKFPDGLRFSSLTVNPSLPAFPYPFKFPPPRLLEGPLDSYDPSAEFVEESLFDGSRDVDQRLFEWGFAFTAQISPANPKDDPILQTFLQWGKHEQRPRETVIRIQPDCAICNSLATTACGCEARALEMFMRQAEDKVMMPIYNNIRNWVREKSQGLILKEFNGYWEQPLGSESPQEQGKDEEDTDEVSKVEEQEHQDGQQDQDGQPLQDEINERWQAVVQHYPAVLEYYYSTLELKFPADSELSVRDPPLSELKGGIKR